MRKVATANVLNTFRNSGIDTLVLGNYWRKK